VTFCDACTVMLLTMAAGPAGGCGATGASPADAPATSPDAAVVELVSLQPDVAPVGATVVARGKGFAAAGNILRVGQGYIPDVASSDGGTVLKFIVPDGLDLCAPGMTPCAGGFARLAPGTYDLSVITREGESKPLKFTVAQR
jgi:hypothetical protein